MERDLTRGEFDRFHDFIYSIAGIHYPAEKLELLSNRIRRRIQAVNETSYDSYLVRIGLPAQKQELQAFLDSITTNETYLFRCQRHWDTRRRYDPDPEPAGAMQWHDGPVDINRMRWLHKCHEH